MTVSFNLIPNVLLTPGAYIEYDASRAVSGLAALPNRVILLGSRLSTGTVAAETLVQITRETDGVTFFGEGSQLARAVIAFKKASKFTEVWAVALDDAGAGVAAQKTITVTGTATSAGVLPLLIHGVRVPVAVASGDTPTDIAASIAAAITAEPNLMFTPAAAVGVVTLTCRHAAAFGESLDIRSNYELSPPARDALPSAVTLAFANTVTGATNPDTADALAVVGAEWFTHYVTGYSDASNMGILETEMESRWGPLVQQDALVYAALAGNFSVQSAYGAARNSQFSTVIAMGESPTPEAEYAAQYAGVSSNEPDPARPRQTLPLLHVLPPARGSIFIQSERNLLLQGGMSTTLTGAAGRVSIERMVTTYQTNAQNIADPTYRNVNTLLTMSALRYTLRTRIQLKYPRHKLADDGASYGPGQAMVTPSVLRAEILGTFTQWENNGWVEDFAQFSEELIVERNATDRDRVDVVLGPNLVNQFRVSAAKMQFIV